MRLKTNILILTEPHTCFLARIVEEGAEYGRDFCLIHDEDRPMVEFYDMRSSMTVFGQFIGRYYVDTLAKHRPPGLCLDGGIPEWNISEAGMEKVLAWLDQYLDDTGN
jgi:hypothetical protein